MFPAILFTAWYQNWSWAICDVWANYK